MQGTSQSYYNPNQVTSIPSWGPLAHPSWSMPPPWYFTSQYHAQPDTHSFQSNAQPQPQWNASHQGWRPQYNSLPALLPPPLTQPQLLPSAPPRQPQIRPQPNLKPNNRQAQQVYSGEASCPTYVVEIQEINLRSRKVPLDS